MRVLFLCYNNGMSETDKTYWDRFVAVVNAARDRKQAAKKLKVSEFYVSWNSSRLRRQGLTVKKFKSGPKVKGAK